MVACLLRGRGGGGGQGRGCACIAGRLQPRHAARTPTLLLAVDRNTSSTALPPDPPAAASPCAAGRRRGAGAVCLPVAAHLLLVPLSRQLCLPHRRRDAAGERGLLWGWGGLSAHQWHACFAAAAALPHHSRLLECVPDFIVCERRRTGTPFCSSWLWPSWQSARATC